MNKEIEVDDNRILKLTNVLSKTIILNDIDNDNFLKALKDYDDYIKNNNLKTKGPLVMSTNIIGQNEQKLALKLMRQLTEKIIPVPGYEFNAEIKTPPCVFSHFEGKEEYSRIARMKMEVYAYEKGYILDNLCYSVMIYKDELVSKIDNFIPVLGKE